MGKRIYIGNLPFSATEDQVRDLFGAHGTVESVNLISDRETGRARGFGFVEMPDAEALAAIEALDGTMLGDRNLKEKGFQKLVKQDDGSYRNVLK
jgi:RNA recognition motif-containing protein